MCGSRHGAPAAEHVSGRHAGPLRLSTKRNQAAPCGTSATVTNTNTVEDAGEHGRGDSQGAGVPKCVFCPSARPQGGVPPVTHLAMTFVPNTKAKAKVRLMGSLLGTLERSALPPLAVGQLPTPTPPGHTPGKGPDAPSSPQPLSLRVTWRLAHTVQRSRAESPRSHRPELEAWLLDKDHFCPLSPGGCHPDRRLAGPSCWGLSWPSPESPCEATSSCKPG